MIKGVVLYILALYLLGLAINELREAEYRKGFVDGQLDNVFSKIPMSNDVHRES